MNLHFDDTAFRELVELSADHFGFEHSHVEKDYWVCKILKELTFSEFQPNIFFKGGTSLSKAYGIIDRFSEDLDLFVYSGNPLSSKQAEKTLNRHVSHFIIGNNNELYKKELSKTGGDFRKLAFSYDTHYAGAGLKENLEVEIKCCTLPDKSLMYYPFQQRLITSIITEYLTINRRQDLISRFLLEAFKVQTIDPKRTLCDKISRLTRLSYNKNYEVLISKHIRDIYDIYRLLEIEEYRDFINSKEFINAMKLVTEEDGLYRNSQTLRSVSEALIFAQTKQILKLPIISKAYNEELRQLMFNVIEMPLIEQVIENFSILQIPLKQFDAAQKITPRLSHSVKTKKGN